MPTSKLTNFLLFFLFLFLCACQNETTTVKTVTGATEEISTDEFLKIIGEAYVYGYPLVLMDLTKSVSTNTAKPHPLLPRAPVNQLGHFRTFPDHTMTAVVKPNVDTYYSIAWLDLAGEAQVLSMPATDRYYLLPFLDAYSNVFASPGTRTTGTDAQTFLIVGPNWEGATPEDMTLIQAPTEMVWLLGRIQVNSPEDGATTVKAIQDGMALVPLSAYGQTDYVPAMGVVNTANQTIIPVKEIQNLDVSTYLNRMAQLMAKNAPKAADAAILERMAKIGLVPGQPFELSADNFILKTKLKALPNFIHKKMEARRANPDTSLLTNGWMAVNEGIGTYGVDYLRRAYIDFIGLGANIPEDAIYPNCTADVNGDPLEASTDYQIHFEADELPPVNAFWSLTAYNADEFLVENELNRFAIGDRDDLIYNEDGSLDIYIQSSPPKAELMKNWLPIPKSGAFSLTLRLYWPKAKALAGDWEIPFVIPVESKG